MTKLTFCFILFCQLYTHEFHFFQCDCTHEYNDTLSHVMGYIENHAEGIKTIAGDFLKHKGKTLEDYLDFIRVPGNKGDELAVHLLACMTNLKVVVVIKTGFWSTVMDCDPFSADVVLV